MTLGSDVAGDVLGLADTFPRPGWVVLDAIRERHFTGEVICTTTHEIRVYADRGRIYLAERSTDPSLGARLVDAGALNASQLEHGAMRIGESEHLGRLFERVPSVDRHQVLVTAELMTDECVGWLASQRVGAIDVTPYRHHPSGAHRWDRAFGTPDMAPGDPLPAPAPDSAPVDIGPPEPLFTSSDVADADDMIRWNEPSWLDEQLRPIDIAGRLAALRGSDTEPAVVGAVTDDSLSHEPGSHETEVDAEHHIDPAVDTERDTVHEIVHAHADTSAQAGDDVAPDSPGDVAASDDWIDQLGTAGLPDPGSDPLANPVRLTPIPPEPADRFELIWPSGDIDEQFGAQVTGPFPNPDNDRAGPTARLVRQGVTRTYAESVSDPDDDDGVEPIAVDPPSALADEDLERWLSNEAGRDSITDEVVLAVRRAVASIETGSLAARRRLADVPAAEHATDMSIGAEHISMPGRVAVRTDSDIVMAGRTGGVTGSSVFDNLPPIDPLLNTNDTHDHGTRDDADSEDGEPQRASALRRLIGSIRRR